MIRNIDNKRPKVGQSEPSEPNKGVGAKKPAKQSAAAAGTGKAAAKADVTPRKDSFKQDAVKKQNPFKGAAGTAKPGSEAKLKGQFRSKSKTAVGPVANGVKSGRTDFNPAGTLGISKEKSSALAKGFGPELAAGVNVLAGSTKPSKPQAGPLA